jgi:hypothetical protein
MSLHLFNRRTAGFAAVFILAFAGLMAMLLPAHATTFNTMRPHTATAYCVADLAGDGGYLSLIDPCNQGHVESWGVEASSYSAGYSQLQNESTGLCMETAGGGIKLAAATCNGDEAQAWLEVPVQSSYTIWQSAEFDSSYGDYYCADANATYGVRAEPCTDSNAQQWDGPE